MSNVTKSEMEKFLGTEEEIEKKIIALKRAIKILEDQGSRGGVMICSHNTILAIRMFGKVSHVVDTKKEGNLLMIGRIDAYLSVPRYEPEISKEWLKEEEKFFLSDREDVDKDANIEKLLLGESELRELVLEDKKGSLEVFERHLVSLKSM